MSAANAAPYTKTNAQGAQMRHLKLLMLAVTAMFVFAAVGTAIAQADEGAPELLILENGVTGLTGTFKGAGSTLATLGGKELIGTGVEGKVKGCKNGSSEKDTTLCEGLLTFTGVKEKKVACRSENAKAEKDAVETVLVAVDLHLGDEEPSTGVLEPVVLFKVLGQTSGESELTIVCGTVKDKVKGVLPCLLLPGLEEIPANTESWEIKCKQNTTSHDQETGKCEHLCEWIKEFPFESNLGNGFEDSGMNATAKGTLSKDVEIDD
jgi:hypothetical protein